MIGNYCGNQRLQRHLEVRTFGYRDDDGRLDLADLVGQLSEEVAAVYIENPNFFGVIEDQASEVVEGGQAGRSRSDRRCRPHLLGDPGAAG